MNKAQLINDVVSIVMPVVVGFLTVPVTDFVKHSLAFIDRQPAAIKQGLTASVAALITLVARIIETSLPTDLALWDVSTSDALVSALFAMGVKHSMKITKVSTGMTNTHSVDNP